MTDPVVAVVGAGPAGLAASLAAAERGVRVVLLDNAAAPGGQILRQSAIAGQQAHRPAILRRVAAHPRITLRSRTEVVHARMSPSGVDLLVRAREQLRTLTAGAVVLAPGASELALPFPGWDLPGVLTPGAAQAMLKAHAVRAGSRVVVAGTGPFLWPVAAGLVTAGAQVVALVEAASFSTVARRAGPLVSHGRIVAQTARYAATLARAGVPVLFGRAVVRAEGDDRLGRVIVGRTDQPGSAPQHAAIEADAACVGWGFVPSIELARSLGCAERSDATRSYAVVHVDEDQATSVANVFAAGEITGIGGAELAAAEGEIAGAAAARSLGTSGGVGLRHARRARRRARRAASVLDRAFPLPVQWADRLESETIVCRCEEVTWGEIAAVVDDGVVTARGVKGQVRCGMGWCQGRICGVAVQQAIAARAGRPPAEVGDLGGRPFAVPVRAGELAELAGGSEGWKHAPKPGNGPPDARS